VTYTLRALSSLTFCTAATITFGFNKVVLSATLFESSNFFALFSLPSGWQIDRGLLDARYRKLQQEFHPDRFASKGDVDKRLALRPPR